MDFKLNNDLVKNETIFYTTINEKVQKKKKKDISTTLLVTYIRDQSPLER